MTDNGLQQIQLDIKRLMEQLGFEASAITTMCMSLEHEIGITDISPHKSFLFVPHFSSCCRN